MPCFYPIPAWRTDAGEVLLRDTKHSRYKLNLPCGTCIGCRRANALKWAVRCTLEQQDHEHQCWATLTYEEKYKPPTLRKDHLQGWLKRLRSWHSGKSHGPPKKIRFFASGEYGDKFGRPHYHAILYGLAISDAGSIQQTWPYGSTQVDLLTPAAISYVAGYTAKKNGLRRYLPRPEQVDPHTGEVYTYQPPFIQMSRNPGIGGNARQYWQSWEHFAITNGLTIPVPRYLHEAWKENTTTEQHEERQWKKTQDLMRKYEQGELTAKRMKDREICAIAKQNRARERRTLDA